MVGEESFNFSEEVSRGDGGEELSVLLDQVVVDVACAGDDLVLRLLLGSVAAVNMDIFVLAAGGATSDVSHLGGTLLLLCDAFGLVLLVDDALPVNELGLDLWESRSSTLQPRVGLHLGHGHAVCGVELKHACYKIAEFLAEEVEVTGLVLGVCLPEEVCAVGTEQSVEGVVGLGPGEGRVLGHHDEQDDRAREQVHGGADVGAAGVDLGSHVALGAELGAAVAGVVAAGDGRGEAEVSDLEVEEAVEEHVFGLEVSVGDAFLVDVVEAFN